MLISDGEGEPLLGHAVYITRSEISSQGTDGDFGAGLAAELGPAPIDPKVNDDGALLIGTVSPDILGSMDGLLRGVFAQVVMAAPRGSWGAGGQRARQDTMQNLSNFASEIVDARAAIAGGLRLRRPAPAYRVTPEVMQSKPSKQALLHYVELLGEWCRVIDAALQDDASAGSQAGYAEEKRDPE